MSTLLVWKEQLQKIYAKYSTYIMKALQFVLGLCVFGLINSNIGFMKAASSILCTVGLSVVCAFLPLVVMVIAATVLVLLHFYTLSMPIALVSLVIFLIMYIFYFRFTPKKAWLVLLTPVAFALKVPFVIPVAFGLLGTPIWVLPAAFGTIAYYMIHFVKVSSSAYKGADAKSLVEGLMAFTKQSLNNKEMWVMVLAVSISILLVYAIRTRSIDHSWKIASAVGAVAAIVVGTAGNIAMNVHLSYVLLTVSGVAAMLAGLILEFLFFSVNYARTERMQFEDDEYYYYVKAVPKVGVSAPEVSVKHINERKEQADSQETVVIDSQDVKQAVEVKKRPPQKRRPAPKPRNQVRKVDHARAADEILLTRSLTRELGLENLEDELNK
ncbi:MAG: hypothetical protein MSA90_10425 [Faecalicatena sp.]|uniref:hypothetical protein n=1 Tax=Faecalicatena sp. TaxID=2005360 RepID=UPI002587B85B|nr:hypothetical protein [Faecalicatena sp.]MCI6465867.1 hypothetical protein [Faecalicatena sp.]MDY5618717.1 hypothetical protein [Lachnospiraceae bacterium]